MLCLNAYKAMIGKIQQKLYSGSGSANGFNLKILDVRFGAIEGIVCMEICIIKLLQKNKKKNGL